LDRKIISGICRGGGGREGFAQLDLGKGMPLADAAKELPLWISK